MFNTISVLVDNDSWILPYAEKLVIKLNRLGRRCRLVRNHKDILNGDVCFMLGCTKIVPNEVLMRNHFNLVVHESDLPMGRGFAPVAWQILEGKNDIPVCLIEASNKVDSGDIWLTDVIKLTGTELASEWREMQGNISIELALRFVLDYKMLSAKKQSGKSGFYSRRRPNDSQLDMNKKLIDLFPLLRVVDNKHYPAFFEYKGCKYKLEISKYE
jgi:methionyl-tRNA formyltransferase